MTTITWSPGRTPWSAAAPAGGIGSATAPRCAWLTLIWIAASSTWCWPTRPYPRADGNDPPRSRPRQRIPVGHRPAFTAEPPRRRVPAVFLIRLETTRRASERRKSSASPSRVKRARSASGRAATRQQVGENADREVWSRYALRDHVGFIKDHLLDLGTSRNPGSWTFLERFSFAP